MKRILYLLTIVVLLAANSLPLAARQPADFRMTKAELLDKIKGGWAAQTIGCTYGGPTEFCYQGRTIADTIAISYEPGCVKWFYDHAPGLYDDIYMDLTFVDVFQRLGTDAPVDSLAKAYADAPYPLWHANQCGRYNLQRGLPAPKSGHWKNNPHADCIDFQIEADFAGLMSPGMPRTANRYADRVGHIMNYGDGWYGGVYVANMYALAFISDDISYIVSEALKSIPPKSQFYQCVSDAIRWHAQYPGEWRAAWDLLESKYSDERGCPEGVKKPLNIDAKINAAYVVLGLLYGNGDFGRTLEVSTRCGQDSDCNPATAAGILGTMLGYSHIPEQWMANIHEVEDRPFSYTTISLNKAYEMSFSQALQVIAANGGSIEGDHIVIRTQKPKKVRYEESFQGLKAEQAVGLEKADVQQLKTLTFTGCGVVLRGYVETKDQDYVAQLSVSIDGQPAEVWQLPARYHDRNFDLFWNYGLKQKAHTVRVEWLNPTPEARIRCQDAIYYGKIKK